MMTVARVLIASERHTHCKIEIDSRTLLVLNGKEHMVTRALNVGSDCAFRKKTFLDVPMGCTNTLRSEPVREFTIYFFSTEHFCQI